MESQNSQKPLITFNEFDTGVDTFYYSRQKGPKRWILHHLFHQKNKYLILFWLIFIIIASIAHLQQRVILGDAINILVSHPEDSSTNLIRYFLYILG